MSHVKIDSAGIREKASIPRRFIVPSVVEIEHPTPLNMEEMVANLVGKPGR
jgi:hypothetical protein